MKGVLEVCPEEDHALVWVAGALELQDVVNEVAEAGEDDTFPWRDQLVNPLTAGGPR